MGAGGEQSNQKEIFKMKEIMVHLCADENNPIQRGILMMSDREQNVVVRWFVVPADTYSKRSPGLLTRTRLAVRKK